MRTGYVLLAVAVALVLGFALGALTSGDDKDGDSQAVTTSTGSSQDSTAGANGEPESAEMAEDGRIGATGDQGTERAPESANDPRPKAPDDVIGDRPGGGGDDGE